MAMLQSIVPVLLSADIPILSDILVILGFSAVVIWVFQRLRLPSILGFLITGMIAGPFGLRLVQADEKVEVLSEIGVILLLFIIGLEFSLKGLNAIRKTVLLGGSVQVGLTVLVTFLLLWLADFSFNESLFTGFLVSLSSTAIVLRLLQERGEIASPHGKIALGVLIFQDIIVVPMMLLAPILGGGEGNIGKALLFLGLKAVVVVAMVIVGSRYVFPRIIHAVARTKSKELFLLTIVVTCLLVAWATSELGLSLALGAFLAGLIISESEYSHQATSNILPFREVFISFFFVSIGMLLDIPFFLSHLPSILLITLLVSVVKTGVAGLASVVLRFPGRTALLAGFTLFQIGEFSFILSKEAMKFDLLSATTYQYFLAVSILTMALTPFVIPYSHAIAERLIKTPLPKPFGKFARSKKQELTDEEAHGHIPELEDHLVIVGYGLNGRNVALAARHADIPYVVIELNADTVKTESAKGEPIFYGDAVNDFILQHVQVHKARVVVVAISDPEATRKIIANVRDISQTVTLIIRTRFVAEMEECLRLGADEVIPEEFETSIEIFTRVLQRYLVPENDIDDFIFSIRSGDYGMFRPSSHKVVRGARLNLPDVKIEVIQVTEGPNQIVGRRLADSHIRGEFGITLLLINRNEAIIYDITPDTVIHTGDVLYLFGRSEDLRAIKRLITI